MIEKRISISLNDIHDYALSRRELWMRVVASVLADPNCTVSGAAGLAIEAVKEYDELFAPSGFKEIIQGTTKDEG